MLKKDLSNIEHSMTNALINVQDQLNKVTTKDQLLALVESTFKANLIDTPASNRLLNTIKKAKSFSNAYQAVYNSILAGANLAAF